MNHTRSVFGALVVAACLLPARAQAPSGDLAQQSARKPGEYVIRTQTNVVLVDVRVWDEAGKPVMDLKQEDFRVFEDGVLQSLTSFATEDVERLKTATADGGPPPTLDLGKLPPSAPLGKVVRDHRLTALFFDMTSMPVDDLMRAVKSADDFLRARLTPADLVAVVTYTSTLRVLQDFTNDRDALQKALESIRVGEASSLSEAGAQGEAGTTNASGQEVVAQDVSAAFMPDETEFNIFNTDEKLAAMESLAKMLRDVPGRKSVIHFSSGVEKTGVENEAQLRATSDAANQSNVSFYTVDARGLAALPPGGDASTASPAGTAVYTGRAVASQISSLQGGRETLATLATDTGGRTFYDLNDLSQAFEQVQAENSTYYLLGYSPANARSDGRFRRLRVEVRRPGVKVQARPGYFAPKDFRQFTREDKELQLEQAMDLETPFVDLPFAVETAHFRQPDNKFYVLLAAKVPGSAVLFLQKSSSHQTEFDFAWRATDASGHTVAALRDTLPLKLSGETYSQVLGGNIIYEGGIVVPAGNYRLKVAVRENKSGKLGTFEQPLELPADGGLDLALSSVVVSNQLQDLETIRGDERRRKPKKGNENPLDLGSRALLPSVTRVFRTDQTLYVYLQSYAKADGSRQNPRNAPIAPAPLAPSVALVFFRGRIKISEAGPFPGKLEKTSAGKTSYFVEIPLGKFPPGRYLMQVNVLDPTAERVAFARVPLAILKTPAVRAGGK